MQPQKPYTFAIHTSHSVTNSKIFRDTKKYVLPKTNDSALRKSLIASHQQQTYYSIVLNHYFCLN